MSRGETAPLGLSEWATLTGEARDFDVLMNYFRHLQEQPVLTEVVLQTHQINRQDRDKPVRFRIAAHWAKTS